MKTVYKNKDGSISFAGQCRFRKASEITHICIDGDGCAFGWSGLPEYGSALPGGDPEFVSPEGKTLNVLACYGVIGEKHAGKVYQVLNRQAS